MAVVIYIVKTESCPEFVRLALQSSPSLSEADRVVRSLCTKVLEGPDWAMEGCLGILDDYDIIIGSTVKEFSGKFDAGWDSIEFTKAQETANKVERVIITAKDVQNYFGEADDEIRVNLEVCKTCLLNALREVGPGETAYFCFNLW